MKNWCFTIINESKSSLKNRKFYVYSALGFILFLIIFLIFILLENLYIVDGILNYDRVIFNWTFIIFITTFIVFLIGILIVISYNEYKHYFRTKQISIQSNQYLTFEDIFENVNRRNIINYILKEPGIHHNELQRKCDLQKGQFQWHLQVLLRYKIIKKRKIGQYSVFYPNFKGQTFDDYTIDTITKSKTTLKILDIIENKPGIISSKIAEQLDLSRSSVKYHVDKLLNENLISSQKKGREIELFPRIENLSN